MINKELLSSVLGGSVYELEIKGNTVYPIYDNGMPIMNDTPINIYELAHKCKEWALDNGYYLTIHNDGIDVVLQTSCKMVENITDGSFKYEPMLVFKACQWILDNKDK